MRAVDCSNLMQAAARPGYVHGREGGARILRNGPTKTARIQGIATARIMHYFACLVLSFFLKRHGLFLLAPLIYISGMLLYMGTISLEVPRVPKYLPPGSLYRSSELFDSMWPEMQADTRPFPGVMEAWEHPKVHEGWKSCLKDDEPSASGVAGTNGYIVIEANGGLNQQRSSICNAVAVARLLNATLLIPRFHLNSVWKDRSLFGDIYDEDHFIRSLAGDVKIVRQLPDEFKDLQGNLSNVYNVRVKAWAKTDFYQETVLPKLLELRVLRFAPFANRLSFDGIPLEVQQLRCRTNFKALEFAKPIATVGDTLVKRMIQKSSATGGKYIAVHLRFEKDMVAFSCCIYDGGEEEKREMDEAREVGWRGKFTRPGRVIRPGALRRDGRCPLTPVEVGMMLRGMGFKNDTPFYLASGKIYKADKYVEPLRQMFPALQTKETLLSAEELAPFTNFSSRMAALDYTVCLHSEVFVTTQGGNFPQILIGHRRFLNKGYAKTIRPDKRKLALLLDNPSIGWEAFSEHMMNMRRHSDHKGHELRKPNASIYTYPAPDCMCPDRRVRPPVSSALEFM